MRVDRTRLPVPGDERPFAFPRAVKRRLDNGLRLWSIERRGLPLVSLVLVVPAGSAADPPDAPGLAALTADMLDEGSGVRSAVEIHEALSRLGAELDTAIGPDAVELSLTVLDRFVPDALELLSDIVARPRLAEADLERVRALRAHRLQQLRSVPAACAEAVFLRAVFGDHAYGHWPSGSSAAVSAINRQDVAAFHAAHYDPARATLAAVGAAPADALARAVEQTLGSWRAGAVESRAPSAVPPPHPGTGAARVLVVDRPGSPQTELRVGHVGAARKDAAYYALVMLNAVLGGHFMSRLNSNLRERRGFTYGVRSSFDFRVAPGPFAVQTGVQTAATGQAAAEILEEMDALRGARPADERELALAAATLTNGYPMSFETIGQVARGLGQLALFDLPDDTFERFTPAIRAVGTAEVARAACAHFRPGAATVVAVGDCERIGAGLGRLGLGDALIATAEF